MPPSTTRRAVLGGLVSGTAALTGCAGGSALGIGTSTTLGCVSAVNWHPQPHTVHLRVRRGGDFVRRTSRHVPSATYRDGEPVDVPEVDVPGPWPTTDLPVLDVRLDDREPWQTTRPEAYRGPACTKLIATVTTERGDTPGTRTSGDGDPYRVVCRFATSCETC